MKACQDVYILRTEQLEEDYKNFCAMFGLSILPMKSINKSKGSTQESLTLDSKILIGEFERDIENIYRA